MHAHNCCCDRCTGADQCCNTCCALLDDAGECPQCDARCDRCNERPDDCHCEPEGKED